MQKSSSTRAPLVFPTFGALFVIAFALSPPARAQTTITYTDTQVLTTDRTTTPANPLTVTIASGMARETGVISGTGSVTKTGAGTLALNATNTYSGGTFLDAGTIELSANDALGTGAITITGGGLRAGGQARTLSNALFTSGTFTVGRATTFAGTTTLTAATTIVASNPDGPANSDTTFGGPISGNFGVTLAEGAGGLGIGSGYLVFSGTNTYTGGTTLRTRLSIAGDAALGAASGALTMEGGTLRGTAAINSTRNVILGTGGGTLDLGSSSSFAGTVSGSGALTKTGAGTLTLSGTNTYTGGTTLSAGALQIGDGGTTGSIVGDVVDNASLTFNRSDATTYAGVISGSGSVAHAGSGTLTLTGTNTYSGGTTVSSGGLLEFTTDANLGAGNITLDYGGLKWATGNTTDISARLNSIGSGGTSLYYWFSQGTFNTNGNDVVFNTPVTGVSGAILEKTGTGTLTLKGGTTSPLDYYVTGGTLTFATGTYEGVTVAIGDGSASDPLRSAAPSAAVITGADTSVSMTNGFYVGNYNALSAALTISGGASVTDLSYESQIGVGSTAGAESTLTVTGAGSTYTAVGVLTIGIANHGQTALVIADGGSVTTQETLLGTSSQATNLITVSGAGSLFTTNGKLTLGGNLSRGSALTISDGASASAITTLIGENTYYGVGNSLTLTGAGSTFTNTGSLTLAVSAADKGTLNLGSAAADAATAAGILDTATVTGGLGTAVLQFNTTGTDLAPTYFTRDGTSTGTGVATAGGLSIVNTAGSTVLSGTGTHTGATIVNGGTLVATQLANGGSASSIGQSTNAAANLILNGGALRYTGAAQSTDRLFQVGSTTAGTTGTLDASGTGALNFTNTGSAAYGTANQTRTLGLTGSNTGANTLAALIADNGTAAVSLAKSGAGTWALTGANTYSGGTTITGGLLTMGSAGALGTGSVSVASGATLDAASYGFDLSRLSGAGTITSSGTYTASPSSDVTLATNMTGTTSLAKTGAGTLTLTGTNTYEGGTSISGWGTLEFSSGANLGTGNITLDGGILKWATGNTTDISSHLNTLNENGGAFDTNGNNVSFASAIVGDPSYSQFVKIGAGTLTLSGATVTEFFVGGGTLALETGAYQGNDLYIGGNFGLNSDSYSPTAVILSGAGTSFSVGGEAYIGYTNDFSASLTLSGGASFSSTGSATYIGYGSTAESTLTVTGAGSKFTNTGTLTLAVSAPDNGTVNLGSAAGDAATAAGILDAATVTGGAGTAVVQFNTTGTALAPTYFTRDGTSTGTGVNTTGGLSLVNTAGTTVLTGTLAHTGATTVNGGKLIVDGSLVNSAVTVNTGGTLGGHGTVGALTIASGGIVSPGNSPGALSAGDTTFAGGGKFVFEVNNATGTPGTNYDLLAISGTLTLTATSANPFILDVTSLKLFDNSAGLAANFDSAADYSFTFLTTTGGIAGFAADVFTIDTTGFTNPFNGTWSVSLTNTGHDLTLSYGGGSAISAVPEPSTYAALLGACALAVAAWRKRRPA